MKKYSAYIFVIGFSVLTAEAQDIEFRAEASPSVLNVGEQFRLVYNINQNVSGVEIPEFTDFQLLGGPMTGSSSNVQIINGKVSKSVQYTYTYYLKAVKQGTFTIPAAKVKFGGKMVESNAVNIEVVQGGTNARQPQATPNKNKGQEPQSAGSKAVSDKDLYVRLHVDKRSAYIGDQIVAWVKLYTKVPVSGIDKGYSGPEFTGFYKQAVNIPPLRSLERENVNGEIYYTGIIQKFILYPQKSGDIVIEPFDMTASVQQQVTRRSRSLFDDFFGPEVADVPVKIKSEPVKIRVKRLPLKPASFSGAVGNFTLKTTVDRTMLKTNEALTYKVIVSGRGNIKLIDVPSIEFPANVEQFDPKTTVNQTSELSGIKTFEFVLIPRYAGEFKILPFDFTYFDPVKEKYITLKSDEYTIQVEKGDEDTTTVIVSGISKEDFKLLGKDILFIKNNPPEFRIMNRLLFGSRVFYLTYIISFVLFVLILILRRERVRRNANLTLVKNRKAGKIASKRLRKAKAFMKHNNHEQFYEELSKAVWGFLGDKLSIQTGDLSKERTGEELTRKKISEELIGELFSLLDHCEYARYAPGAEASGPEQYYHSAVGLLSRLAQKLK